jgi:hypothetical protein
VVSELLIGKEFRIFSYRSSCFWYFFSLSMNQRFLKVEGNKNNMVIQKNTIFFFYITFPHFYLRYCALLKAILKCCETNPFNVAVLQNKQGALEPDHRGAGLQRPQDVHGDELTTF